MSEKTPISRDIYDMIRDLPSHCIFNTSNPNAVLLLSFVEMVQRDCFVEYRLKHPDTFFPLSERKVQVIQAMMVSKNAAEIARRLGLSSSYIMTVINQIGRRVARFIRQVQQDVTVFEPQDIHVRRNDQRFIDLGLNIEDTRLSNALKAADIRFVEKLLSYSAHELVSLPNFGTKCLLTLIEELNTLGAHHEQARTLPREALQRLSAWITTAERYLGLPVNRRPYHNRSFRAI